MFCKVFSAAIHGIDGLIVSVEADVSNGLPLFDMVGLLGSEVKEARERVRIALKNSEYHLPPKRITINLSPADIRKEGTAFDLPVAIAILAALGYVPEESLKQVLIIGELSLNGIVNKVNGVLPIVYSAKQQGFLKCILPMENIQEGGVVEGISVYGVESLRQTVELLNSTTVDGCAEKWTMPVLQKEENRNSADFSEVSGQIAAKRAIEVAVCGMHNILMVGPPGAGKTMLAQRIPGIMPELTFEESIEMSKIYSIAGLMQGKGLITTRPFRAPHHTITATALVGGGHTPRPGEASLAHLGVLFLDELAEFRRSTLEVLRQPLEDRSIMITRLNASYRYPAGFMMAAAMNPCNCGYYPDRSRCRCSSNMVKRYLGRISRPLLDRFDISVEAVQLNYKDLQPSQVQESSEQIRRRVEIVREIQLKRYRKEGIYFNSQLNSHNLRKYCKLGKEEERLLERAFQKMNLTARAYNKILKLARTIADMDQRDEIHSRHISEAICYRSMDQKYWGE